jgi:hypothetical protein
MDAPIIRQNLVPQFLGNPQFAGASVHDSGKQSVDVVSGGSGLEWVQTQRENVVLAWVT